MARVGSVFSEEADAELRRLRGVASALAAVTPAVDGEGVDPKGAKLISFDGTNFAARVGAHESLNRDQVAEMVRGVGAEVAGAVQRLQAAMEDHFVRFFDHLKKRSDDELALWMPKADAVSPEKAGPLGRTGPPLHSKPTKASSTAMGQAVDALHTWLAIELEATMTTTHATKAAIYVRSNDAGGYLRRVASVPAKSDLPADVALASGSSIGSVVQNRIGVTIAKSRKEAFEDAAKRTGQPAMTSAVVFNVESAVILPLVVPSRNEPVGCIVIADKREPGQRYFTAADEHRVWAFVSSCEGVFARYPHSKLLQYAPSRDLPTILKGVAHITPAADGNDFDPLTVNGVPVPTKAPKLMLLRTGTAATAQAAKEAHMAENPTGLAPSATDDVSPSAGAAAAAASTARRLSIASANGAPVTIPAAASSSSPEHAVIANGACGPIPFSDEDVLESVAPYVRNVEEMWHKSLELVMGLRTEVARWEAKVGERDARIVDLEVAIKNLAKQLHRTKADVRRIQRAAPEHLMQTVGGGDEEATDGNNRGQLVSLMQTSPTTHLQSKGGDVAGFSGGDGSLTMAGSNTMLNNAVASTPRQRALAAAAAANSGGSPRFRNPEQTVAELTQPSTAGTSGPPKRRPGPPAAASRTHGATAHTSVSLPKIPTAGPVAPRDLLAGPSSARTAATVRASQSGSGKQQPTASTARSGSSRF